MINNDVFTAEPPPSICALPVHLLRGQLDDKPIRFPGVARLLAWPRHRRGELLAWVESLPAIEPTTPLLGGVWSCRVVRKALAKAPQFLEYVDPDTVAQLR